MSTLQESLDRIRAGFKEKAPAAALEVMHNATEDLRNSGIMDRIPRAGDTLAPFELKDTDGTLVSSEDLLKSGPLVISFYRGGW